jgi:hypothetical protein
LILETKSLLSFIYKKEEFPLFAKLLWLINNIIPKVNPALKTAAPMISIEIRFKIIYVDYI